MADPVSWRRESRRSWYRATRLGSLVAFLAALVASLGLWGAAAWFQADPGAVPVASRAGIVPAPARQFGTAALLAVPPDDLPAVVRDRYRLRPDRRLLAAVAEVQRLRTGAPAEAVRVEFQDGRWRLLSGDHEVGVLSELPTFEEGTDLLVSWAARLPPAAGPGAVPDTAGLEQALREADVSALLPALSALRGSPVDALRDEAKLRAITLGLAWQSTLTVDSLDQADPLLAEAWAWLAVERTVGSQGPSPSEALIARALGYEAAAGRAGAKLAADDPVRFYVLGDETRLGARCAEHPEDRPCRFLHLALLAERDQVGRFRSAVAASPFRGGTSLAVRGLETRLSDFAAEARPGRDLAARVFRIVAPQAAAGPDTDPSSVEGRTRDFEAAVDALAAPSAPGTVGVAAIQGAYRAEFYSGLYQEARFFLHQFASGPAAQQLAARIVKPAAGTAEELRNWVEVSGGVLGGSTDLRPLSELLQSARSIGGAPLFDLAGTIARHTATTQPLRRQPIPALFERLDTRPAHLAMAARTAERNLASPGLFERLARAAAEAAPHLSEELPALAAKLRADAVRLRAIADDPAMPRSAQTVALDALLNLGKADESFVRARYEAIAADPDQGPDILVDFLEERGDLQGALAALETAVKRGCYQGELGLVHLQTEKARLRLRMGDPDGAFAIVRPLIASWKEEALQQGALIELARKHPENALTLATRALERYPDRGSENSGLIVRARWQLGDFATAAQEVAASRNGIGGDWNRYLPEAFAETFATAPEEAARRAFSELATAGIAPHVLADLAIALGRKRGLGIALPLLAGLRDPQPEWQDSIRLATYDLIREKSGEDAALAWIRAAVPERSHNFAMTLYQMRRYDLLLGLFANGEEGGNPGIVRMVKAASLLHLRETRGPRWDGLAAEVTSDPSDDFFARATRYLLGQTADAGLPRPLPDAGYLASVGWLMGMKKAGESRFADADGWFQVALESGQQQQPPHAWSWVIESDWLQSRRSLDVLAKEGEIAGR